ncbi:type II toxin-antitoxin system PemK/MazF family toxin [Ancylobacter polymorphus]|uniref:Type II toxin-antitoxin system PemK/MazF family toxin n=1 Tax=Ancylobacter polymorphus TaxID=223390 RepID=A0A9E6ZXK1_9HYPH|nr:type II toxin-antitoxin system PemK/MazF family toxin [Ancylobacter polymorphus]UOK69205.1 type II toxin-antitoxin system PemK/MazF family toxin [Ancylobacter polymorphus]
MMRGHLVTVSLPGDIGKPRPALVIQADQFAETATVTVLPLSGTLVDAPLIRIPVEPSEANGLRKSSQIMVDKPMTIRRDRTGPSFGQLEDEVMLRVTRSLALFLGLG